MEGRCGRIRVDCNA